ncbi:hypothetical protein RHGRI_000762 [Rhododendron griersonianum]|uniref:Uncharacterized protein n=1 Tax=Rhododendron griersonianum TaxID=479676 RepID=A0AAV6LI69_9ERIC|nr:hypothetical protein RHGRI_000762 [Rhododendron griersonianum]
MARTGNKNVQAKLVLLGDMGAGKTSLVLRFVKGQFYEFQESTIGAAFFTQVLSLNEGTIKFDIWDTAGQERYHSLAPMYYRGAAAAVVVYDITSMDSFVRGKKWVRELQRQGNPNLVTVLVANKADLEAKRQVENEVGEQYAKDNRLMFLETSAKTAQNVNELFYEIGEKEIGKSFPCQVGRDEITEKKITRRAKRILLFQLIPAFVKRNSAPELFARILIREENFVLADRS